MSPFWVGVLVGAVGIIVARWFIQTVTHGITMGVLEYKRKQDLKF